MTTISKYENGNCLVTISDEGTKIRRYEGTPEPIYPESIDLKISNWCDGGCPWCHENSTTKGRHAKVEDIISVLFGLPRGVEIAIGGGDPFSHPRILPLLQRIGSAGLIANITVNAKHLHRHRKKIEFLRRFRLIHGLGISYDPDYQKEIEEVADDNTVIHVIAGVHSIANVFGFSERHKLLVLGYKEHGRGCNYLNDETIANVKEWRYWLPTLISRSRLVSFDNLAIEQLRLQERASEETWNRCYMGDDGQFTMYIDAVNREFAVSSTHTRHKILDADIRQMFSVVRKESER